MTGAVVDPDPGGSAVRQLAVVVPIDEAELVADRLWAHGVLGIEEFAGTSVATGEPSSSVCLVATPVDGDVEALAALVDGYVVRTIELEAETYGSYLDAWRDFADPVFAGERVVLWPAWWPIPDPDPSGHQLLVVLEPGRVFGSGSHPTTTMAVRALERWVAAGDAVIDVGCGSGVLALAAAQLGATSVVAVDLDADAVEVTRANAERNRVHDVVDARVGSVEVAGGQAAVVVANLSAGVLVELGAALAALVASGGVLLLTGILDERREDVEVPFAALGLEMVEVDAAEGWVLLALRRG